MLEFEIQWFYFCFAKAGKFALLTLRIKGKMGCLEAHSVEIRQISWGSD